jgi:predicted ester cyclase
VSVESNKAIIRAIVHAIAVEHRLDVLDAHPGLAPMKPLFAQGFVAWPDLTVEIRELIAEGDWVACRLVQRGTHHGEWHGMPATGRQAEWEVIATYRFADGKVVESHGLADELGLREQLGAAVASAA